MKAPDVLEIIDNALYLIRLGAAAADPADAGPDPLWFSVSNQALVLRSQCYGLARDSEQPWRRSFDMRAEEAQGEHDALMARVHAAVAEGAAHA